MDHDQFTECYGTFFRIIYLLACEKCDDQPPSKAPDHTTSLLRQALAHPSATFPADKFPSNTFNCDHPRSQVKPIVCLLHQHFNLTNKQ
jgi:hypothetical protein